MMLSIATQAQTKCDWSGYYVKKTYQRQNYFEFRTNIDWDSCIDYTWLVYDYQLKRKDTLQEVVSGAVQVQFNVKGKYQVQLKVVDKCNKCDTIFYQDIEITVYGPKSKLSYSPSIKNCKSITFEIPKIDDTCIENYYEIWDANEFTKNLTDKQWKEISDSLFYFTYDWDGRNLVYYSQTPERGLKHEFSDSGRYLVMAYWINKCTGIDTFTFNKIIVCPKEQTSSIKNIIKSTDLKIIGYYDMIGRRVDYMRSNEVYIILYSNGQRRKVMRHE